MGKTWVVLQELIFKLRSQAPPYRRRDKARGKPGNEATHFQALHTEAANAYAYTCINVCSYLPSCNVIPSHEPVIAHPVRIACSADLHVLNKAKVSDLVCHELFVILLGCFVPVGHDAADVVWLLYMCVCVCVCMCVCECVCVCMCVCECVCVHVCMHVCVCCNINLRFLYIFVMYHIIPA